MKKNWIRREQEKNFLSINEESTPLNKKVTFVCVRYIEKKKIIRIKCTLNGTGRDYRSSVCLRNVFTSLAADIFPPPRYSAGAPSATSRTQQGWIRGGRKEWQRKGARDRGDRESRTLEISFITARTVNLHRIDTMIVRRRRDAWLAAHPPWNRRRFSLGVRRMFRHNVVN